jgi:hypothetical protein
LAATRCEAVDAEAQPREFARARLKAKPCEIANPPGERSLHTRLTHTVAHSPTMPRHPIRPVPRPHRTPPTHSPSPDSRRRSALLASAPPKTRPTARWSPPLQKRSSPDGPALPLATAADLHTPTLRLPWMLSLEHELAMATLRQPACASVLARYERFVSSAFELYLSCPALPVRAPPPKIGRYRADSEPIQSRFRADALPILCRRATGGALAAAGLCRRKSPQPSLRNSPSSLAPATLHPHPQPCVRLRWPPPSHRSPRFACSGRSSSPSHRTSRSALRWCALHSTLNCHSGRSLVGLRDLPFAGMRPARYSTLGVRPLL